jgi:hypothetical protein
MRCRDIARGGKQCQLEDGHDGRHRLDCVAWIPQWLVGRVLGGVFLWDDHEIHWYGPGHPVAQSLRASPATEAA